MAKKWKEWQMQTKDARIERHENGVLSINPEDDDLDVVHLSPSEARRLFQKLSGDYRD